jgi:hypothetical protein
MLTTFVLLPTWTLKLPAWLSAAELELPIRAEYVRCSRASALTSTLYEAGDALLAALATTAELEEVAVMLASPLVVEIALAAVDRLESAVPMFDRSAEAVRSEDACD